MFVCRHRAHVWFILCIYVHINAEWKTDAMKVHACCGFHRKRISLKAENFVKCSHFYSEFMYRVLRTYLNGNSLVVKQKKSDRTVNVLTTAKYGIFCRKISCNQTNQTLTPCVCKPSIFNGKTFL